MSTEGVVLALQSLCGSFRFGVVGEHIRINTRVDTECEWWEISIGYEADIYNLDGIFQRACWGFLRHKAFLSNLLLA
jgi:hypothetical protein